MPRRTNNNSFDAFIQSMGLGGPLGGGTRADGLRDDLGGRSAPQRPQSGSAPRSPSASAFAGGIRSQGAQSLISAGSSTAGSLIGRALGNEQLGSSVGTLVGGLTNAITSLF